MQSDLTLSAGELARLIIGPDQQQLGSQTDRQL
jgi:hypothetical protein